MKGKVARGQGASSPVRAGPDPHGRRQLRQLEDQLSAMAENDDRSRMHDDRADAFIWCMIHLAGG